MPTLFVEPQLTVDNFRRWYNKTLSLNFTICMDKQLTKLFELKTGLKPNKNLSIAWASEMHFFVKEAEVSSMPFCIYANHNWNPVTILWRSKSRRIYKIEDSDVDCDDIEFWFEDLDVALIHRQMFPNVKLPFKLKDLSYELVVTRINMDCTIQIQLKENCSSNAEDIVAEIDGFIADFNNKSEKKGRVHGVIHHWKSQAENGKLVYEIDLGSTGPNFFKKLLPYLSLLNYFTRVELC